jgi:hypothetical protein
LFENWYGEGFMAITSIAHLEISQGMKTGEERATKNLLNGTVSLAVDILIPE